MCIRDSDNIFLQNCLFVHDFFHDKLLKTFNNIFVKAKDTHELYTRNANDGNIALPRYNSTNYGLNSIYKQCIDACYKFTNEQKFKKDKIKIKN